MHYRGKANSSMAPLGAFALKKRFHSLGRFADMTVFLNYHFNDTKTYDYQTKVLKTPR